MTTRLDEIERIAPARHQPLRDDLEALLRVARAAECVIDPLVDPPYRGDMDLYELRAALAPLLEEVK